tara:strand:+ start:37 stop:213 length:177 start_codon:yes stop_codon:yes gene_type:complete
MIVLRKKLIIKEVLKKEEREKEIISGAPGEIRTPDPLVRSQVLYPAELRAQSLKMHIL